MNRNSKILILSLGLALIAVVSCTSGELPLAIELEGDTTSVSTPVDTQPPVPPDTSASTPVGSTGPNLLDASLLSCRPQPYAATTAVVGPKGGLIMFGNHALKIYEGALSEDVTITAEQVEGAANSVRFSPEGLKFAVPALLSLSYKNCDNVKHWKRIVYTDESLKILEPTLSYDFSNSSQVRGLIYHFSRYAVAY